MLLATKARNIGCFLVRTHGWDEVWEKARDPAIWQARYERFLASEALIHSHNISPSDFRKVSCSKDCTDSRATVLFFRAFLGTKHF